MIGARFILCQHALGTCCSRRKSLFSLVLFFTPTERLQPVSVNTASQAGACGFSACQRELCATDHSLVPSTDALNRSFIKLL